MTAWPETFLLFGGLGIWAALFLVRLKGFLHVCQLEEYFTASYVGWLWRHAAQHLHAGLLLIGPLPSALAAVALWTPLPAVGRWVALTAWGIAGLALLLLRQRRQARKPLAFTARATRLYATATALGLGPPWATAFWALTREPGAGADHAQATAIVLMAAAALLGGYLLALANLLLFPWEEVTRQRFERAARAIVRARRPRIIAVTGSAGKTTTKEILQALLSTRYKVLRTPASFNTSMGVTRVIRESLTDQEIFIVEMGAYKRGDISRLCRLVGAPDIAIVTQINEQHLERFGSLENTARAKFECVAALRPGGTAILNFDNPHIRAFSSTEPPARVIRYGTSPDLPLDLRASNIVTGREGTSFDLAWTGQHPLPIRTSLLGHHNVSNILAATAAAHECGLEISAVASALRLLSPPRHRLQPMPSSEGVTVLDDSYNANPDGLLEALDVLASFGPRRRVLVTPGLVEMGPMQAHHHRRIGQRAAGSCDLAILVGPRQTDEIRLGLLDGGFTAERLHVARDFAHATDLLRSLGQPDDVVLFANDLPDQYDEGLRI